MSAHCCAFAPFEVLDGRIGRAEESMHTRSGAEPADDEPADDEPADDEPADDERSS